MEKMIQEANSVRNRCFLISSLFLAILVWAAMKREPATFGVSLFVAGVTILRLVDRYRTIIRQINEEIIQDVMSS